MKHKFNSLPSQGWLYNNFKKYLGQRSLFVVKPQSFIVRVAQRQNPQIDALTPLVVNGIFRQVKKLSHNHRTDIILFFGDVFIFHETGMLPISWRRRTNKILFWPISITEIDTESGRVLDDQSSLKPRKDFVTPSIRLLLGKH